MQLSSAQMLAITCRDLAPRRGGRDVATGITFASGPGDALVLRGGNGSGKTSVLRAVAGLCGHRGGVTFARGGVPVDPGAARAEDLHLLGAGDGLTGKLSAAEHVRFWSGLYAARDEAVLTRVGLDGLGHRPANALSTGQRRRLGLARLLMAPRAAWLLDEPLSGLDTAGRTLLLDAVADHRASGGLVLMATHEDGLPDASVLRLS